jgi:rhodanese-related sulfurtransferase
LTAAPEVRDAIIASRARHAGRAREIALLDVRPERDHAGGHPLFAASLPFDRLELEILDRVPQLGTPIVVCDGGEGLAALAQRQLTSLGYADVAVLEGGVDGWAAHGYELFKDVNAPSKAFGELVAERLKVPFIAPAQLHKLIAEGGDVAVADVRRLEEYTTMSIPRARSAPGAEIILSAGELAPDPATLLVVNCAGRTRSIIGAQSLRSVGVANNVMALENGTIGWKLAGLDLETGASQRAPVPVTRSPEVGAPARLLADRAGVGRTTLKALGTGPDAHESAGRCQYRFDVRDGPEYVAGHPPGFRWAPGGQLVQETDVYAPVRGARVALFDDGDRARANVTASWLAQMGWDVAVVDDDPERAETGPWQPRLPPIPEVPTVTAGDCHRFLEGGSALVVEVGALPAYLAGHIPGSAWARRGDLALDAEALLGGHAQMVVLVSECPGPAQLAAATLPAPWAGRAVVLEGGKAAWREAGLPLEPGPGDQLSAPDAYRRPYEGTAVDHATMQAYIDWELGLVAQLERDATHGFFVLEP